MRYTYPQSSLSVLALIISVITLSAALAAKAQNLQTLYALNGGLDGANPYSGVVIDSAGNLYGTAYFGGLPGCAYNAGCGIVFELSPTGSYKVLYSFTGGADGGNPDISLLRYRNKLYGTTDIGGVYGYGTVFQVTPKGKETVLHGFTGGADGSLPRGVLIHDREGNLYGTTVYGGNLNDCNYRGAALGCGVVFKLTPSGIQTVLYTFTGAPDGAAPVAGLTFDNIGNLYGTTSIGGDINCLGYGGPAGCGTIFELSSPGAEKVLYTFGGQSDGVFPAATLIRDAKGHLYGTTYSSNNPGAAGTVFELSPTGDETILYAFNGSTDGAEPERGLVRKNGMIYGTTRGGGAYDYGTVFQVDSFGNETVLHSFTGGEDGGAPEGGVVMDKAGNLYGTTNIGGTYGFGTVFKLSPQQ